MDVRAREMSFALDNGRCGSKDARHLLGIPAYESAT
jgi:hypothetical protein